MSGFSKGLTKVEVGLRWDPSPAGEPDHDLDLVAATYTTGDPYGNPAYLVHFASRSPDGTITLLRDSRTGQGFGDDEVMVLELDRLAATYARVVVGVAIQQPGPRLTFAAVANPGVRFRSGPRELAKHDFAEVGDATAATVAEFARDDTGEWRYRRTVHGFDTDPTGFAGLMGRRIPT